MSPELYAMLEAWRNAPPGDEMTETRRRHAVNRLVMDTGGDAERAARLIAEYPPDPSATTGKCCPS